MSACPKCGKHIRRKSRDGLRKCRRHGPVKRLPGGEARKPDVIWIDECSEITPEQWDAIGNVVRMEEWRRV